MYFCERPQANNEESLLVGNPHTTLADYPKCEVPTRIALLSQSTNNLSTHPSTLHILPNNRNERIEENKPLIVNATSVIDAHYLTIQNQPPHSPILTPSTSLHPTS